MRSRMWKFMSAAVALVAASAMAPGALAQCGMPDKPVKPASWHPDNENAHLVQVDASAPSIVGMWHVVFTAHTLNGSPIPDTEIDNAMVVFNSDGTEIMNSGRPPQDGNFCLGVWEQTGRATYAINHIPWGGNDNSNAPSGIGNPQAGDQLVERVTLGSDGKSYSGAFRLDAYDINGRLAVSFTGVLTATRVTVSTPFSSLL